MATIAHTAVSSGRIADCIQSQVKALIETWKRYRLYRATLTELESLAPRELDDIGVSPAQIRSIAHNSAFGPQK